jgi:predicted membrane protein
VNITLGSGVNYTIDVAVTTGAISAVMGAGAHVGDVSLDTTTGAIDIISTDDVVLLGNATFDLSTTTGGIDIIVDYPSGVGGSISCAVNIGSVDITATGWTMITSNHYESSDYNTASQTLTITAGTTTGGIDALVT